MIEHIFQNMQHCSSNDPYCQRCNNILNTTLTHTRFIHKLREVDRVGDSKEKSKDLKRLKKNNAVNKPSGLIGFTPLHSTAFHNEADLCTLLIHHNASVDSRDNRNFTPLFHSALEGNWDVCELLWNHGACLDVIVDTGHTILSTAIHRQNNTLCRWLLAHNADPNLLDNFDQSPLYLACNKGFHDVAKMLLENKADVNATNKYHQCAIHAAACQGFLDICDTLISEYDADILVRDDNGYSPQFMAYTNKHKDVIKLMYSREVKDRGLTNADMSSFIAEKNTEFHHALEKRKKYKNKHCSCPKCKAANQYTTKAKSTRPVSLQAQPSKLTMASLQNKECIEVVVPSYGKNQCFTCKSSLVDVTRKTFKCSICNIDDTVRFCGVGDCMKSARRRHSPIICYKCAPLS